MKELLKYLAVSLAVYFIIRLIEGKPLIPAKKKAAAGPSGSSPWGNTTIAPGTIPGEIPDPGTSPTKPPEPEPTKPPEAQPSYEAPPAVKGFTAPQAANPWRNV